jgi:hypothetical protein
LTDCALDTRRGRAPNGLMYRSSDPGTRCNSTHNILVSSELRDSEEMKAQYFLACSPNANGKDIRRPRLVGYGGR